MLKLWCEWGISNTVHCLTAIFHVLETTEKRIVSSQRLKFVKLWNWLEYSERNAKNQTVSANRWEDQCKHRRALITPYKSFKNWLGSYQANFGRICMESPEHNSAYTDLPPCLH